MFGTVLDKLDTFFGRAFLVSRFFPFLVFLGLNLAVAYAMFPDARADMRKAIAASADAGAIVYVLAGFLLIAAIAYTLAPFSRITMELLEGDWLVSRRVFEPLGRREGCCRKARRFRPAKRSRRSWRPSRSAGLRAIASTTARRSPPRRRRSDGFGKSRRYSKPSPARSWSKPSRS
jgi:hypothetical protein